MAVSLSQKISELAQKEGLIFLGVTHLEYPQAFGRFQTWLQEEKHGGLQYLKENLAVRENPGLLLEGAKRALFFAVPYGKNSEAETSPRIAKYARIGDYHRLFKKKGDSLIENLQKLCSPAESFRAIVDTVPILEKGLAEKLGKGFLGKNTCFIHPEWGSFFCLGILLTTWNIEVDKANSVDPHKHEPDLGGCGKCQQCQIKCPTGALDEAYQIDAGKCLSYWTIEHRGVIPRKYWAYLKEYWYGCDICQDVCPYNKNAKPLGGKWKQFPSLFEVATMDQKKYEAYFGGTAMTRAKREGLVRNALIALFVSKDEGLGEVLRLTAKETHATIRETWLEVYKGYQESFPPVVFETPTLIQS